MKYAFMTMDVESFYDVEILKDKNIAYNDTYSFLLITELNGSLLFCNFIIFITL